jgi:uncharacterized membrane protein YphA (DoxX/SURF4 family)
MRLLLNITRWVVGLLFIFSGLVKANDPLGLSYKMQEFFEVWGWNFLDNYTLSFSILMIAFEIIAGIAVILGWRMKLFSWLLLLLIIFFTFLTGYAVLSGKIRSCGCFGDCIPLTAEQSFGKDLILSALIVFIFINRKKIKPLFPNSISIMLLLLGTVFSFSFQWYVLRYLPVVDCLPYKIGNNILEKMKSPPGSIPDSMAITFIYKKDGKEVSFQSGKFPDDFDDSLYKYVGRKERLVRKGNDDKAIKDFTLVTPGGTDSTKEILAQRGYMLFLFVKDGFYLSKDKFVDYPLNSVMSYAQEKQVPLYVITNSHEVPNQIEEAVKDSTVHPAAVFMCDAVAIKTASRVNPTLYLIKDGTVVYKWPYARLQKAFEDLHTLK